MQKIVKIIIRITRHQKTLINEITNDVKNDEPATAITKNCCLVDKPT